MLINCCKTELDGLVCYFVSGNHCQNIAILKYCKIELKLLLIHIFKNLLAEKNIWCAQLYMDFAQKINISSPIYFFSESPSKSFPTLYSYEHKQSPKQEQALKKHCDVAPVYGLVPIQSYKRIAKFEF